MKLSGNTVFITGGSSGIGLQLAGELLKRKNTVIICGRSKKKLTQAKQLWPKLYTYQCNLADPLECQQLTQKLKDHHPKLNVLINNAALVHKTSFIETDEVLEMATLETNTNFLAPVRLTKMLFEQLHASESPAIINITTGLVYTPRVDYPFYNATKAALHSFTKVLRMQLQPTGVKVVEVLFPAVRTPWHAGNPPKIAISSEKAVQEMIRELQNGKAEIRIGKVKLLYVLSRCFPKFALKKINGLSQN